MKKLIVFAALSLAFSSVQAGLFSIQDGTKVTQEQFDSLTVGKSKKADVTEAIGHPDRREQLGNNQAWYYEFSKISYGKATEETAVFEFNKADVLVDKYRTGDGKDSKASRDAK
jgi:outer membrane protein assembly factor BamE (lipoprotein component of BamABCDE complex)